MASRRVGRPRRSPPDPRENVEGRGEAALAFNAGQHTFMGMLDCAARDRIAGWAYDPASPKKAVILLVSIDGKQVDRVRASRYRADLEQAGFGNGKKSFELALDPLLSALTPHLIEVRREGDGTHIPGSPRTLEPEVEQVPDATRVAVPNPEFALQGNLDVARRDWLAGWAHDPATPGTPVSLLVTVNDRLIGRVLANRYRADLQQAGFGDGRRSFELTPAMLLSPLSRQVVEVRCEQDGRHLPGSPRVLEPEAAFSDEARAWMIRMFADADSDAAQTERLAFLTGQLESLLQRRADLHSRRFERQLRRQSNLRWIDAKGPAIDGETGGKPSGQFRALVIDERLPATDRDAGSNAILSHMRSLQRLGFEVSFASAEMTPAPSSALEAAEIACCRPPWYASVEEVLRREAHCFDLVYLHRLPMADRYTALVRQHQPKARLLYSIADLHYLRTSRQAQAEQRPELLALANRMQVAELLAISRVDQVITHSSHEAEILRRQVPPAKVQVVPWSIQARPTAVPFAQRRGMAFIGHYGHQPNLDAARWLIDEILPMIRAHDPAFECLLVGNDMPASLQTPSPGIVLLGAVERIADIFDRVRLTVAPLAYGAGIKGKVLDSIAAGVPCVCTPIAAEGLDFPEALTEQGGNATPALAAAILRLHDDKKLNRRVSDAGLAYIRERMSEPQIDLLMRKACGLPAAAFRR